MARSESRTVELNYRADLSQLKSELAKLPDITAKEAKAMVRELDKQLKRSEKAMKKAGQQGAKGFKDFADAAGDSEQALIGVADIIEKVNPQAADMVRTLADMGGASEGIIKGGSALGGLLRVAGPVGAAVAAAAVAYDSLSESLDKANAKIERNRKELDDQIDLIRTLRDAEIAAKVATEEMTEAEADQLLIAQKAEDVFSARTEALEKQAAALKEARSEAEIQLKNAKEYNEATGRSAELVTIWQAALDKANGDIHNNGVQMDVLNAMMGKYQESLQTVKDVEVFNESMKEGGKAADKHAAALAQLQQITNAAQDSMLEGEEAILRARDRQIAQIATLIEDTETSAAAAEAMAAVSEAAAAEIAALNEGETLAPPIDWDAVVADAQAAADEVEGAYRSMMLNAGGFMGDVFTDFTDAAGMVLGEALSQQQGLIESRAEAFANLSEEERKEKNKTFKEEQQMLKEGALKLFRAEKSAAISSAIMSGAVAVLRALEELGPIAGGIAAAGIAATTVAQTAVIAAQPPPTLHRGGGPDEINALLRRGEGVLTQQGVAAMGGDAGIAAANRGEPSGVAPIQVNFKVGSRVSQAILVDAQRAPGPGRRASRSSRPTGRRNPYGSR